MEPKIPRMCCRIFWILGFLSDFEWIRYIMDKKLYVSRRRRVRPGWDEWSANPTKAERTTPTLELQQVGMIHQPPSNWLRLLESPGYRKEDYVSFGFFGRVLGATHDGKLNLPKNEPHRNREAFGGRRHSCSLVLTPWIDRESALPGRIPQLILLIFIPRRPGFSWIFWKGWCWDPMGGATPKTHVVTFL